MSDISTDDLRECIICKHAVLDNGNMYCGSSSLQDSSEFTLHGNKAAAYCGGFEQAQMDGKCKISNNIALKFILAGKCEFVMVSGRTGVKIGYKLTKRKSKFDNGTDYIYFLSVKDGNSYIYAGIVFYEQSENKFKFAKGQKGALDSNNVAVRSILYVLNNFLLGNTSLLLSIYHVGTCGRCGKRLDDPSSILTGLGPHCAKVSGVPRVKLPKRV